MNVKQKMPVINEEAVMCVAHYIDVPGFVFLNAAVTCVN